MSEKQNTLTFTQTPEEVKISIVDIDDTNVRQEVCIRVRGILLNEALISYGEMSSAFNGISNIDTFIEDIQGNKIPLNFDLNKKRRLLQALQSYSTLTKNSVSFGLQCGAFASIYAGMNPSEEKSAWDFLYIGDYPFNFAAPEKDYQLQSGDIVFLGRIEKRGLFEKLLLQKRGENIGNGIVVENHPYHFAVYLGEGLYISKLSEHNVGVCDFQSLRNLYSCHDVFLVTPK